MTIARARFLLLACTLCVAACSDTSAPTPNGQRAPARLIIISGDSQTAVVGKVLPNPVVVRVVDSTSAALAGQLVNFHVASGSISGGVVTTDADGLARETWTLGTIAGIQRLDVGLVDKLTNLPLSLTARAQASALADAPAQLAKVSGDGTSMPPGARDTLVVRLTDRFGNPVPNVAVDWSVAQSSGTLSVTRSISDAFGLAQTIWTPGAQSGPAMIGASIGNDVTTTFVLTISPVVASVAVTPPSSDVAPGGSVQLGATLRDAAGNTVSGERVQWSSSNSAAASVDSTGFVHALSVGTTTITATAGGKSGTAIINVANQAAPVASVSIAPTSPAISEGTSTRLTATARDANGAELVGRTFAWSTTNSAVAMVDQAGVVTGTGVGTVTISATSEGKTGSTQVTVASAPSTSNIASVEVTPSAPVLGPGATVQLSSVARDAQGNALAGKSFTWTTSNPGVATVTQAGLVTAVAGGTAEISAGSEGRLGSSHVSVVLLTAVSGDGQSGPVSVALTDSLVVKAFDSSLHPAAGITINWAVTGGGGSVSPASAVTDASGIARVRWTLGPNTGTQFVNATITGIGSVSFHATAYDATTNPAPVANVTVNPPSASVNLQGTAGFSAVLTDAQGNAITGRTVVWSSSDSTIAVISGTGVAVGQKEGTATITATSEGHSGNATLTVHRVPAFVSRTDHSTHAPAGSTVTVTVNVRDIFGASMPSVPVRFVLSNDGGAADAAGGRVVSPDSVLTDASGNASTSWTMGTLTGLNHLSVFAGGPTAMLTDTVTLAAIASVVITPDSYASAHTGFFGCQSISNIVARDIYNNSVDTNSFTLVSPHYSSLDANIAYIEPNQYHIGFNYRPGVCFRHNGDTKVIVEYGGKADTATVSVNEVPTSVTVNGSYTLRPDSTTIYTAVPRDGGNQIMTGETATWMSTDPTVATVDSTGLVHAIHSGMTTIRATVRGVSGEHSLFVGTPPVFTTTSATSVTSTSATLNGTVDTGGQSVDGSYTYGTDPTLVSNVSGSSFSVSASSSVDAVSRSIAGLIPNTTYYFRITGRNVVGTGTSNITSFTTLP